MFPPDEDGCDVNWDDGLVIEAMPVNSAICVPRDGDTVPAGSLEISGYAVAYGRSVARIDLSTDAGETWRRASFKDERAAPEAWQRWHCEVELHAGRHELIVRAVDDAGQSQPERAADVWNFAGYLSTAWHRIVITVQ